MIFLRSSGGRVERVGGSGMVGVGRSGFVIGGCCCERGDRSRWGLEVSGVRKIELHVIANAEDLITEHFRMLCE